MKKPQLNTVETVICGEIFTLTGTESAEYIQKVARYIDKKIADLQKEKQVLGINSFYKTLLIAVNITDDLFKAMEQNNLLQKEIDRHRGEQVKLQEENLSLNERLKELQLELSKVQDEFNNYIDAFDRRESPHLYKVNRKQTAAQRS